MRITCPHCRSPIEFLEQHADTIVCPFCGFRVDRDESALAVAVDRAGPTLPPCSQASDQPGPSGASLQATVPWSIPPIGAKLRSFGDYELLEEIARGGMGVVYKARQMSLNRIVALKMMLAGQLASEAAVNGFGTEAEAEGDLQHPNVLAIHEVGEHEGQHYFSMDYVEGPSLAKLVRQNPLSATQAAEYVKSIAEATHYAHLHGVLHRDLKPSNVLLDNREEKG